MLDLKLPKVDGLDGAAGDPREPRAADASVVMMTSSREERDIVESYDLGVNSYLVKPIDFDKFVDTVQTLGLYWVLLNEPPPRTACPERSLGSRRRHAAFRAQPPADRGLRGRRGARRSTSCAGTATRWRRGACGRRRRCARRSPTAAVGHRAQRPQPAGVRVARGADDRERVRRRRAVRDPLRHDRRGGDGRGAALGRARRRAQVEPLAARARRRPRARGQRAAAPPSARPRSSWRRATSAAARSSNSALDCIVTIDHEGLIVDFNPAAEETFGYLADDVRGKPMVEHDHPAVAPRAAPRGLRAAPGDRPQDDPRRARRADGDALRRHRVPRRGRDHAQRPEQAVLHRVPPRRHGRQERAGRARAARAAAAPRPEDGGDRQPRGRRRARLQQHPHGDPRGAARSSSASSRGPGRCDAGAADRPGRDARRRADPAAARVQPAAGAASPSRSTSTPSSTRRCSCSTACCTRTSSSRPASAARSGPCWSTAARRSRSC